MPRKSKKNPDNLSSESVEAIKKGCQQSLEGKVTEADFSQYADEPEPETDVRSDMDVKE